jgi:hypothetical protein
MIGVYTILLHSTCKHNTSLYVSCLLTHSVDCCALAGHLVACFQDSVHRCCTLQGEDHTPDAAQLHTQQARTSIPQHQKLNQGTKVESYGSRLHAVLLPQAAKHPADPVVLIA